jgi:hypothetical protein
MPLIEKNDLIMFQVGSTLSLCGATHARHVKQARKGKENDMRTHEISSPRAAELYFTHSFIGDIAAFLTNVHRGLAAWKRPAHADRGARSPESGQRRLLDRVDAWFANQDQKARERYLAASRDVFDLERRIDAIDRGNVHRYY